MHRCVSLSLSSCAVLCTVGGSVQTVASFPGSGNEAIQTGAYTHKLLVQSCSGRPVCGYASASKQIRYLDLTDSLTPMVE